MTTCSRAARSASTAASVGMPRMRVKEATAGLACTSRRMAEPSSSLSAKRCSETWLGLGFGLGLGLGSALTLTSTHPRGVRPEEEAPAQPQQVVVAKVGRDEPDAQPLPASAQRGGRRVLGAAARRGGGRGEGELECERLPRHDEQLWRREGVGERGHLVR
eukprot:scaffold98475_cov45-Phaeocystis_antarctica.AAC.3